MIVIIPARGGSKGLPRKNLKLLGGHPLIQWTIDAALGAGLTPTVSTDDEDIARVSEEAGARVPFVRPAELATDEASVVDVVLHALDHESSEPDDPVCLLQPTSPLRNAADIRRARAAYREGRRPVVSVSSLGKPLSWLFRLAPDGALASISQGDRAVRRQEEESLVVPNGAIYIIDSATLRGERTFIPRESIAYLMPAARSVDIDTASDLAFASFLVAEGLHE